MISEHEMSSHLLAADFETKYRGLQRVFLTDESYGMVVVAKL